MVKLLRQQPLLKILLFTVLFAILASIFFISRFQLFENAQVSYYPNTKIKIENTQKSVKTHYQCQNIQHSSSQALPNPLSLLVWNIHKGEDTNWQTTLQNFSQNRPLVLLQEATNLQQFNQYLPDYFQLHSTTFQYQNLQSGVLTASDTLPIKYCANLTAEPWIKVPKSTLISYYPLSNGDTLLVANVHAINFEWGIEQYHQQMQQLSKLLAQHQGAIILAGDFNAWNKARTALIKQLAEQLNLKEVVFSSDERSKFLGNPLDYAFIRGFEVNNAQVIKTTASDHNPLLFTLSLAQTGK